MSTVAVSGIALPLGQSIARAALASSRGHRVVGLDLAGEDRAAVPQAQFRRGVHVSEPRYFERLSGLLREEHVDLYVPGAERELRVLAECRAAFEDASGCRVLTNDPEVLDVGQSKLATARLLETSGLAYPRTVAVDADRETTTAAVRELGFPCIAKGDRAGGPLRIDDAEDVHYVWRKHKDFVFQEYLGEEGDPEYTWGVFAVPGHGVVATIGMERRLRYGLTWRGRWIEDRDMAAYVASAVEALGAHGPVNAQLRLRAGEPVIHEINVRCSSTTVFRALCGWNEIDMSLDWLLEGQTPNPPAAPRKTGVAVRAFSESWFDAECGSP